MSETPEQDWGSAPCYPELIAIVTVGAAHVVTELAFGATAARVFNVTVSVLFLGYVIWRLSGKPLPRWWHRATRQADRQQRRCR